MGAPSKKRSDAAGSSEGRAIGNFKDKVGEPEKTRWNQKRQHNNKNLEEQKGQKGFFFLQTIKNKENIWTRSCQQEWLFWGLVAKSGFWQERRRQQREKVGKRVQPASWPYLWNFYTDQKVYRKLKKKGLLSPSLSPKPGNFYSQRYHLLELQVILAYKKSYSLIIFLPSTICLEGRKGGFDLLHSATMMDKNKHCQKHKGPKGWVLSPKQLLLKPYLKLIGLRVSNQTQL